MVVSSFVTRFTFMVKLMVINVFQVCKNTIPTAAFKALLKLEVAKLDGFSLALFGLEILQALLWYTYLSK